MIAAPKRRGRKAGSLVRCRCKLCGTIEMRSGSGSFFRCTQCRLSGRWGKKYGVRAFALGNDVAMAAVAQAIRRGELAHPTTLRCADCSGPASEYEHRDYNQPLRVDPICRSCNLRRGPAIPLDGSIQLMVAKGIAPYRHRRSAEQVLMALGHRTDVLRDMPPKLTAGHWRQIVDRIWPELIGAKGAPAIPVQAEV